MPFFGLFKKSRKNEANASSSEVRFHPDGPGRWLADVRCAFQASVIETMVFAPENPDAAEIAAQSNNALDELDRRFESLRPLIVEKLQESLEFDDEPEWEVESMVLALSVDGQVSKIELSIVNWYPNHWVTVRIMNWSEMTLEDVSG